MYFDLHYSTKGAAENAIDLFHVVRNCFLNNALSLYGSYDCT